LVIAAAAAAKAATAAAATAEAAGCAVGAAFLLLFLEDSFWFSMVAAVGPSPAIMSGRRGGFAAT
jgi:hypothetical protein